MGADPPAWFAEQVEAIMQDAHEACGVYHTTAKGQIMRVLHRAFEYGKRFVSDQLPLPGFVSAAAKEAGETGRLADAPWIKQLAMEIRDEHFENLSTFCVETIIIKALRFANAQPPAAAEILAGPRSDWPDPTPEMQASSLFEVIWSVIKTWDIAVPEAYSSYSYATGNHVRAILDAINTQPPSDREIDAAANAIKDIADAIPAGQPAQNRFARAALIAAAKARSGA